MANLQETARWETGIYQLETSDPVMGGADGVDNRQAKQLGNRTLWLKNELELMSRTIPAAVTKSDAVNSNSSTDVATSKAVKTAYDKAVAAESAATGAVKTSGNQDIGGNKTFTSTAFFKGGAFVSDSAGDFAANQCLQLGANNVNTYFYNKRSGKYLSMRNDGELRYDGKRLLNVDDLLGMVPSGTVLYFAGQSAPAGWLKANGAAVSRTAYAALFAAIGTTYGAGDGRSTFNLPDLRGEFLRGWDDGRGVDTGRVLGSAQADEFKSHQHMLPISNDTGKYEELYGWAENQPNDSAEDISRAIMSTIREMTSKTGGTETRPRNIALLAIIKI